jgi:hypothetical protein
VNSSIEKNIEVEEYIELLSNWKSSLTIKEQKLIFLHSMENFLFHFDSLPIQDKIEVKPFIQVYFEYLQNRELVTFTLNDKKLIAKEFIRPLSKYFIVALDFKAHGELNIMAFIGINIDICLLLLGILKKLYFIPIATILFIVYWLFIEIKFAKKKLVF